VEEADWNEVDGMKRKVDSKDIAFQNE